VTYPKRIRLKLIWTPALMAQHHKQWGDLPRAKYKLVTVHSKGEEMEMRRRNKEDVEWCKRGGYKMPEEEK